MKPILNHAARPRLQKAAKSIALGFIMITAIAASAHADDRHGNDDRRGAGERDWRAHTGRRHGYEPGVVYAPPVVYTAPQYEQPGINLIVPLNFR